MGVEPDGAQPGIQSAPDVGGQAVPHHDGFLQPEAGNGGEAGVEKRLGGLVGAHFLGNENVFEIGAQSGVIQPGILDGGCPVGSEVQVISGGEIHQKLLRTGHELMLAGEQYLIPLADGLAAVVNPQFPE